MSRFLALSRNIGSARAKPSHAQSQRGHVQSRKKRGLSATDAATLLRLDWAEPEPHIDQDEVFDDQFERRAREIQRTPSASDGISIVPAKTGPWSGNNQLGISRNFAPDANNHQTILKMDEWGDVQTWRVTLGIDIAANELSGVFDVRATIIAGAGGTVQQFDCDWQNGVSFNLNFNALKVVAQYNRSDAIPDGTRLIVTLGRGGGAGINARPQLTELWSIPATPATSNRIAIPRFATGFKLIGSGGGAATAAGLYNVANFVGFHGADSAGISAGYNASQLLEFMGSSSGAPIPNWARFMSYNNASLALDTTAEVTFILGI